MLPVCPIGHHNDVLCIDFCLLCCHSTCGNLFSHLRVLLPPQCHSLPLHWNVVPSLCSMVPSQRHLCALWCHHFSLLSHHSFLLCPYRVIWYCDFLILKLHSDLLCHHKSILFLQCAIVPSFCLIVSPQCPIIVCLL